MLVRSEEYSFITYVSVDRLSELQIDKLVELFTKSWTTSHVLYKTAGVTTEEFRPYAKEIVRIARINPWTGCVALYDSSKEMDMPIPEREVVGFHFAKDTIPLPHEVVDKKVTDQLSSNVKMIFQFYDELLEHFWQNPIIQAFHSGSRQILYCLYGGIDPNWGRERHHATMRQGVLMQTSTVHREHMKKLGFWGSIATHSHYITLTARMQMIDTSPNWLLLSRKKISTWEYKDEDGKEKRPFQSVTKLEHVMLAIETFKSASEIRALAKL